MIACDSHSMKPSSSIAGTFEFGFNFWNSGAYCFPFIKSTVS